MAEKRAEAAEASTRRAAEAAAARKHAGEEGETAWEYERAAEAARKRAARPVAPPRVGWEAGLARSREALAATTMVAVQPGAPTALPRSRGQMKPKQPTGSMTDPGQQARAVRTMSADEAGARSVRFAVKRSTTQTMAGRPLASVRGPNSSPLLSTV